MGEPIRNRRLNDLASAPTPQNTPSTAVSSFAGRGAGSGAPTVSTIHEEDGGIGGAFANNPALLSMIQGKLGTLVGKSSGYIESLPSSVRDRISGLKGVQAEHSKLEAQFQEDLLALEKKYHAKYEPLYARRAEIIKGTIEPSVEEILAGKAIEEAEDDEQEEDDIDELDDDEKKKEKKAISDSTLEEDDKDEDDIKGIPDFWLTALKNLLPVAETITERDDEALQYLTDIRMKYLERPGFALEFEFAENPFFTNKVLTKTYYYQEETGYGGDFIYDHAEGDKINWTSPENNLTVRIEKRKQRNKHTKATRTIEKTIPEPSFFSFFSPPKALSLDGEGSDEEEDEDAEYPEDLEQQLELDYQLGEEIKEKLITRAIDWYTGEALRYEDIDEFDEEEDFDDEDDEENDDDDDDEDDDDEDDDDDDEGTSKPGSQKQPPQECNQS